MKEQELTIRTPEGNYGLDYCREKEVATILEYLKEIPFVFVYAEAGNGKTSFGVEFRERVPGASLILGAQLGTDGFKGKGRYDNNLHKARVIVVDEFDAVYSEERARINELLSEGKKFVFMVHCPKSRFVEWRKQRQERVDLILGLINDYPNIPWLHLQKYKEPKT